MALMSLIATAVFFDFIIVIPKCGQGMYECIDQMCINSTKVCDGKKDCSDSSDEYNCLEKRCADYGAHCDDGACLYPHQMCDDVYHCNDFSDERACHAREFDSPKLNCLIECDSKCVEVNKICDHFSDCSDSLDEQECGIH
ncbi:Low-density lipoprotein receptor-related protein 4 [Thelohanellus kitauei]|uniref:Low-density lipoprotein receptor-related protein 4 n=1 Tax=Thelohanellus kitauei TaxID=669202 RepID=A0A0C2MHA9_THEKT|nr:Low-density lipoprotein receptor-related protein 4 [Thelohanellus kitauei]